MTQPAARLAQVGDVEIAYETFGYRDDPPVLLVMGFATQMLGWPDEFCSDLAARGHFVIRFDNRDVGLSTHLHGAPSPDVLAALGGDFASAAYTLSHMAADAVGLLDALRIDAAHLVGVSMGGMIAQTVAIEDPDRVLSLTSMSSTTGDPTVGAPSQAAMATLMAPPAVDRQSAIERNLAAYRVIGSPAFAFDEHGLRDRATRAFDRSFDPVGATRQLVGVLASGDRTTRLQQVEVPALVIHGAADPLIDVSGGRATAAAIPGCELVEIEGMGHDLPRELWARFIDLISAHVARAEPGSGTATRKGRDRHD
jgi:pimeloyl-ACP methyl ester carboxylesterase